MNIFRCIKNKLEERYFSVTEVIFITSILFVVFYNVRFFRNVIAVYPVDTQNIGFIFSLFILFISFTFLFFALISSSRTIKFILAVLFLFSSLTSYFMDNYGVIFDHNMIRNIFETNWNEVFDLITIKMFFYFLLLGILPVIFICRLKISHFGLKKSLLLRTRNFFISIIVSVLIVSFFGKHYTSFFREHGRLRGYVNPYMYIYGFGKYIGRKFFKKDTTLVAIGRDAKIICPDGENRKYKKLVIVVVGEAARADHFSLNGYGRDTNPYLKNEDVINFTKMYSCGTSTAYSVPCMFSIFTRKEFSNEKEDRTENVLDVLSHTGQVDILWRDNNSSSKGVAARVTYEDYKTPELNPVCSDGECRDEGMIVGLDEYVSQHKGKNILIILHQMGNHGPAYYKRYPKEFERFSPVCTTNQIEKCSKEELVNAYDNAIVYTDYFLYKVIDFLKKHDETHKTAMIYLSDHGESLGENGIYLHGIPYFIAPESQKHIAGLMWFGDKMKSDFDIKAIKKKKDKQLCHDYLFHTLLGLFKVSTKYYNRELDILN